MNPTNPTNFGSAIGGGGEIKAALARRGLDTNVLSQVSPASGSPNQPAPAPLPPAPSPQGIPGGAPAPSQTSALPSSDTTIILKALTSKLKSLQGLQEQGIQV